MSINFGIPPYPPEKLQKVGGKTKRQENTPKNKKNHNLENHPLKQGKKPGKGGNNTK